MKSLFFDAGPIISLVMSRLVWILPELKTKFNGAFYITPAVELELVDRPLNVNRFKFEALQVLKLIKEKVLEVYTDVPRQDVLRLKKLVNSTVLVRTKPIDVVQEGELESVASARKMGVPVVMDERTLRLFIEDTGQLRKLIRFRLRQDVKFNDDAIRRFQQEMKNTAIIRSVELAAVAYRLGLLNSYLPQRQDAKGILIDSVLWATKYSGCAVTQHEIEEIKQYLLKQQYF